MSLSHYVLRVQLESACDIVADITPAEAERLTGLITGERYNSGENVTHFEATDGSSVYLATDRLISLVLTPVEVDT